MNNLSTNSATPIRSDVNASSVEQALLETRTARRLGKIVSSIQLFLENQVIRFEQAMDECEAAVENDKNVQLLRDDLEAEKQAWREAIEKEVTRLNEASESLADGWQQLEDERRNWLDHRDKNSAS